MWSTHKGQSTKLNEWQQKAITKAIQEPFQLIQGPPGIEHLIVTLVKCIFILTKGTGKSVTGARLAYLFAKLNRELTATQGHRSVLYCGPSNKSVDVVFSMYPIGCF